MRNDRLLLATVLIILSLNLFGNVAGAQTAEDQSEVIKEIEALVKQQEEITARLTALKVMLPNNKLLHSAAEETEETKVCLAPWQSNGSRRLLQL